MVKGVLRLKCGSCGHRFVLQVNRKELRLGQDAERTPHAASRGAYR